MPADNRTLQAFEDFYEALTSGDGALADYPLKTPLWQFLCFLADSKNLLLHGSGKSGIEIFEPRKSSDVSEFGDRKAVYAASDGIWPLYFAILDRDRFPMSLNNSATRLAETDGSLGEPFYFFSISDQALAQKPFRDGAVYVLPRESFKAQAPIRSGDREVHVAQWASPVAVRPLACLKVTPQDFPFLAELRGHDDKTMFARAKADPDGFPWVDDPAP